MNNFILATLIGFSSVFTHATEVYQCNKKGSIVFQAKPCEGHTGKTTADKLREEQEAKEKRLAEIQEKEEKLQERLKQQPPKDNTFKAIIQNLKAKLIHLWQAIKQLFTLD